MNNIPYPVIIVVISMVISFAALLISITTYIHNPSTQNRKAVLINIGLFLTVLISSTYVIGSWTNA